jgi:hypothetical protein
MLPAIKSGGLVLAGQHEIGGHDNQGGRAGPNS